MHLPIEELAKQDGHHFTLSLLIRSPNQTRTLREYWSEYTDNDGQIYWWNEITGEAQYTAPTKQLDTCLAYLRDRVGVPRDLSPGAAAQFRAHLNWAIALLNCDTS